MNTSIIIGVIAIISIISAFCAVMNLLKVEKVITKEETPAKETVPHRPTNPKSSLIPSHADDDREKKVDRLLKKRNLSLSERQFIYDFLMETGKEKWRDIKGYEGYYRINTYGVIESCRYGRLIEPSMSKGGAYAVGLSVGSVVKNYRVHKLVAETFIPNPSYAYSVRPLDGNYSNCDVRNLMWYKTGAPAKDALAA